MECVKRTIISSTSRSEPIVREIGTISVSEDSSSGDHLPEVSIAILRGPDPQGSALLLRAQSLRCVRTRSSCALSYRNFANRSGHRSPPALVQVGSQEHTLPSAGVL